MLMRNNDGKQAFYNGKKVSHLLYTGARLVIAICGINGAAQAFTQVVISTSAPIGIEEKFIADTTAQYTVSVKSNPLAAHTYGLTIYGPNPNYNPPPAVPTTLQEALALGATVYVYGFANGMTYQQNQEIGTVGALGNLCQSATNFMLVQTNSMTFDKWSCMDTITTILAELFNLSVSTPTVIPPVP